MYEMSLLEEALVCFPICADFGPITLYKPGKVSEHVDFQH